MRISLWVVALALASSAMTVVPPVQGAVWEGLEFTVSVTDIQDAAPGFVDIREIAFAEPGDDTLIVRYQPQDFTDPNVLGEVDFWFTAPAGAFRSYALSDGSHSDDIISCTVEGAYEYCIYAYETLEAVVGDTLTGIYSTTYMGGIVDYGPAPGGAPGIALGAVGTDYTLTGCSKTTPCNGVQTSGGVEALGIAVSKSSAETTPGGEVTYDLTVTNPGINTNFTLSAIGLPKDYVASFAPLSGTIAHNATAKSIMKIKVPAGAGAGTHISFKAKAVSAKGAEKTVDLGIDIKAASTGGPGTSGGPGPTGGDDTTTQDGDFTTVGEDGLTTTSKKSPGIEFALNFLAIGLMVLAMRRRVR